MPKPVITSALSATGTVGVPFSYTVTASYSPTAFSYSGLPDWLPETTYSDLQGGLHGTPTEAGTSSVILQASNASGSSDQVTLTLVIAPAAGAPVITSATSATGAVGTAFSYQAAATHAPTSYSLTMPSMGGTVAASVPGLSFDTASGLLAGTPTAGGTYTLGLSASNASGPGNAVTLTLVVSGTGTGGTGPGLNPGGSGGTGSGGTATPAGDGGGTGLGYAAPNAGSLTRTYIGRLILGQDLDGTLVTAGAVITEMLTYAIDAGAPFQIGPVNSATRCSATIALGYLIPLDEVKDVTCAEVFRKMARWLPHCVQWFDYTTTPPTLHFEPGGTGGTAALTLGTPPLVAVGKITPRHDLQAPAVVIHYEVTTSINGTPSLALITDAAPGNATGQEFGAVVLTIPMRGQSSTSIQQRVYTVAIQDTVGDENSDQSALIAYLAGRSSDLMADINNPNVTAAGITIKTCSRTIKDPSADAYNPASGEYGAQDGYDDSLGYELVEGSISDWMASQYNIKDQEQIITFSYSADASANGSAAADDPSNYKKVTFPLRATNASAQLYTSLTSYNPGDTPPRGLAASYLATISALQWSGSVELSEQTAGVTVPEAALGNFLNIAGSENEAWASMNALIVGEEVQASTGRTTLTLGPALHLSPQDLVARLYITRPGGTGGRQDSGAKGTGNSDARTSGQPSGNNTVPGATKFPFKDGGTLLSAPTDQTPAPFAPLAPDTPLQNDTACQINQFSYLRTGETTTSTLEIEALGNDLTVSPGDYIWLDVESSDGQTPDSAGLDYGADAPWLTADDDATELVAIDDDDTDSNGNTVSQWKASYLPVAKVIACSGTATKGGLVIKSKDGTACVEVVSLLNSHLTMKVVLPGGVFAMMPTPSAGDFSS